MFSSFDPKPLLDAISESPINGYAPGQAPAAEPTALNALALHGHGRMEPARAACQWLADTQRDEGSLSTLPGHAGPRWPTSLAVLAWEQALRESPEEASPYASARERGLNWILQTEGETIPPRADTEHDTTLVGWPWVEGTHSWCEPTALCVLALKSTGHGEHARTREAVRLLIDRLLPQGGCNYGNTVVLGQTLRPHLQPTGLVMMALADELDESGRIQRSLDYLQRNLAPATPVLSLCYGLLGLAAHDAWPPHADRLLESARLQAVSQSGGPLERALVLLTLLGDDSPLLSMPREEIAL